MISVIVTAYNVEEYLPECLDSILGQTFENFELILVDDGATDSSGQICDNYAKRDKRIKVIHKSNGGLPAARKTGVEHASFDMITFVDGDDLIDRRMLSVLYKTKMKFDAEIASCWFIRFSNYNQLKVRQHYTSQALTTSQALSAMLYHRQMIPSQWGKLYDKKLFDGLDFPTQNFDEDFAMTYKIIARAKVVAVSDFKGYFYRNTIGSMSRTPFSRDKMLGIRVAKDQLAFMKKKFSDAVTAARYRIFAEAVLMVTKINNPEKFKKEEKIFLRAMNRYKFSVIINPKARRRERKLAFAACVLGAKFVARTLQRKARSRDS